MGIEFLKTRTLDDTVKDIVLCTKTYINEAIRHNYYHPESALGAVCAVNLMAPSTLPPFNRSTVDGYAVKKRDVQGATESIPSILMLVDEVKMGEFTQTVIRDGQCAYVPTGGMIPQGADAMVMIEDTEQLNDEMMMIYRPAREGEHISYRGDDIKEGDILVREGKTLNSYDIAVLAGMGITKIPCFEQPKFIVISTGDEIVDLHEPCELGKIRDINGYGISAWICERGGVVISREIIEDQWEKIKHTVEEAIQKADVVVISGGSSMGTKDYTKDIIESFPEGKIFTHGLSVKPGKPTIIGTIGKKLVFGLPGHPVSALLNCQQLIGAFMDTWFKRKTNILLIQAILTENIHGSPGKDLLQPVKLIPIDKGMSAQPIYGKSGLITTLSQASGWIRIHKDVEGLLAGQQVEVELLQEVRL